jgi:hypothetical protein
LILDLTSIKLSYAHGDKQLLLAPLKGQINPDASDFTVGKVKVEIRLAKMAPGRWVELVGDSPDREYLSRCITELNFTTST